MHVQVTLSRRFAPLVAGIIATGSVSLNASTLFAQDPAARATRAIAAISTDPAHGATDRARMEVLHITSGGERVNGVAYVAAGAGVHPTLVFFHGLPGNEQNLDLAQAVRRAGWNVITQHYRGSWGSGGSFRFANTLDDAKAVLAYLRDPAVAQKLGIDTTRIVVAGHSMGGWVAAHTAGSDRAIRGVVLISAADMGGLGAMPRADLAAGMAENMESLAGVTSGQMADELIQNSDRFALRNAIPGLASRPILVLTSDDGGAPSAAAFVSALRAAGDRRVATQHAATDHSWSDSRIELATAVIRWLETIGR